MPLRPTTKTTSSHIVTVGVGGEYIYDINKYSTAKDAIQAAINTNPVEVIIYGDHTLNSRVLITQSNIIITLRGVITLGESLYTSFPSETEGVFHIRNITSGQSNVTIRGGKIDLDNKLDTPAITMWGGGNSQSVFGLVDVTIDGVSIQNYAGDIAIAPIVIVSARQDIPHGKVKSVKIINCKINNSDVDGVLVLGDSLVDLQIDNNEFDTINRNPIQYYSYKELTLEDFKITNNIFINTKNKPYDTNIVNIKADINDGGRHGVKGLIIENNRFVGDDTYRQECIAINIHSGSVAKITGNYFYKQWSSISVGESYAGSSVLNPSKLVQVYNNTFEETHFCEFDHDSAKHMQVTDNLFLNTGVVAYTSYSSNTRESFHGNKIVNPNNKIEDPTLQAALDATTHGGSLDLTQELFKAAIRLGANDEMVVKNNIIIDNRKLPDPGLHEINLGSIAGGSLTVRTRWVAIAYTTSTGVTRHSIPVSLSVPANQLLTVNIEEFPLHIENYVMGINDIIIYVGDSVSNLRKQFTFDFNLDSFNYMVNGNFWTEPVAGVNLTNDLAPTVNTTRNLTKYGIYNLPTSRVSNPNIYSNNIIDGVNKMIGGSDSYIQYNNRFKQVIETLGSADEFSNKDLCSFSIHEDNEYYYRLDLLGKITNPALSINKVFALTECEVYICTFNTTGTFDPDNWEPYAGLLPTGAIAYNSSTSYIVGNIVKMNQSATDIVTIPIISALPAGYGVNDYFPLLISNKITLPKASYILRQITHNNEFLGTAGIFTLN